MFSSALSSLFNWTANRAKFSRQAEELAVRQQQRKLQQEQGSERQDSDHPPQQTQTMPTQIMVIESPSPQKKKVWTCEAPNCRLRFTSEESLRIHSIKHNLSLTLTAVNPKPISGGGQTATPRTGQSSSLNTPVTCLSTASSSINPLSKGSHPLSSRSSSTLTASGFDDTPTPSAFGLTLVSLDESPEVNPPSGNSSAASVNSTDNPFSRSFREKVRTRNLAKLSMPETINEENNAESLNTPMVETPNTPPVLRRSTRLETRTPSRESTTSTTKSDGHSVATGTPATSEKIISTRSSTPSNNKTPSTKEIEKDSGPPPTKRFRSQSSPFSGEEKEEEPSSATPTILTRRKAAEFQKSVRPQTRSCSKTNETENSIETLTKTPPIPNKKKTPVPNSTKSLNVPNKKNLALSPLSTPSTPQTMSKVVQQRKETRPLTRSTSKETLISNESSPKLVVSSSNTANKTTKTTASVAKKPTEPPQTIESSVPCSSVKIIERQVSSNIKTTVQPVTVSVATVSSSVTNIPSFSVPSQLLAPTNVGQLRAYTLPVPSSRCRIIKTPSDLIVTPTTSVSSPLLSNTIMKSATPISTSLINSVVGLSDAAVKTVTIKLPENIPTEVAQLTLRMKNGKLLQIPVVPPGKVPIPKNPKVLPTPALRTTQASPTTRSGGAVFVLGKNRMSVSSLPAVTSVVQKSTESIKAFQATEGIQILDTSAKRSIDLPSWMDDYSKRLLTEKLAPLLDPPPEKKLPSIIRPKVSLATNSNLTSTFTRTITTPISVATHIVAPTVTERVPTPTSTQPQGIGEAVAVEVVDISDDEVSGIRTDNTNDEKNVLTTDDGFKHIGDEIESHQKDNEGHISTDEIQEISAEDKEPEIVQMGKSTESSAPRLTEQTPTETKACDDIIYENQTVVLHEPVLSKPVYFDSCEENIPENIKIDCQDNNRQTIVQQEDNERSATHPVTPTIATSGVSKGYTQPETDSSMEVEEKQDSQALLEDIPPPPQSSSQCSNSSGSSVLSSLGGGDHTYQSISIEQLTQVRDPYSYLRQRRERKKGPGRPPVHNPVDIEIRKSTGKTSTLSLQELYDDIPSDLLGRRGKILDPVIREQRKREANKEAAARLRYRKRQWMEDLEERAVALTERNRQLAQEVDSLRSHLLALKTSLLAHSKCSVPLRQIKLDWNPVPSSTSSSQDIPRTSSQSTTLSRASC